MQLQDQGARRIKKHVLDRDGVGAVSDFVAGGVLDIAGRAAGPLDGLRENQLLAAAGRPVDDAVVDEVGVDLDAARGRETFVASTEAGLPSCAPFKAVRLPPGPMFVWLPRIAVSL